MRIIAIVFALIALSCQGPSGKVGPQSTMEGAFVLRSDILNEDRTCLVYLPESYRDSSSLKRYPVMILLDGNVHFKAASGVVHFMSSTGNRNYMIPEMIVVAIENTDRERDLTVTRIKTVRPNTMGGGRNFLDFIQKELIPYVDANYRTDPERILAGHSLGGLLTVNAYMDEESIFNAFLSIDPSIWWEEDLMKQRVDAVSPDAFDRKLYIATANQGDARIEKNKRRHEALYTLLTGRAEHPELLKMDYFENEDHRSVPLIAMYEGLRFFYEGYNE